VGRVRSRTLSRQRKKNGRSDPPGNRARSRTTFARHLRRSPQSGTSRPGSHRSGGAFDEASGRSSRSDSTLAIPSPAAERRTVACPCGRQAPYRELRSKPVLTALGRVEVSRPYYLCAHCRTGQFPADVELDIEHTEFSPGVRRRSAPAGAIKSGSHLKERSNIEEGPPPKHELLGKPIGLTIFHCASRSKTWRCIGLPRGGFVRAKMVHFPKSI